MAAEHARPAEGAARAREGSARAQAAPPREDFRVVLDMLLGPQGRLMEPVERLRCLRDMCAHPEAQGEDLGLFLLDEVRRMRRGLAAAQKTHARLEEVIHKLTEPPLHPAVFLGTTELSGATSALVSHGNTQSAVHVAEGVDLASLAPGDEVLLNGGHNALLAKSPVPVLSGGETANFDRVTADGRMVLTWRDEVIVVSASGRLRAAPPKRGDTVRWDRNAWMALEVVEQPNAEHLCVQETPPETFADIGGLDEIIAEIKLVFLLHFRHPNSAERYHVRRCGSVMLQGGPGNGKTMLGKATANWMATLTPSRRSRFINVKPGSLKSMWYSQTEANIRNLFRAARELAEADPSIPVVLFMDEIDSLGAARSSSLMHIDDRVQQAFAAELNGFEARGNVLVICTTNRIDALDPALVREGRLGDRVITVPRPNLQGARSIFGKYFTPDLPYAANGRAAGEVRAEIVESALARIFAPNGAGELAALRFRDGKRLGVKPSHLISGAMIAGIANDACLRACLREVEGGPGEHGIGWPDVEVALARRLDQAARLLTPHNCRGYVSDLPDDVDVVSVERPRHRQIREYRYVVAG